MGKTKERFIEEGAAKYLKLIGPYAKVDIVEIKDERGKPVEAKTEAEGMRVLRQAADYVLIDEGGKALTSLGFARLIKSREAKGTIDFVLGGPFGVSKEVKDRASSAVSLSPMTLTHEMARLVLLEQIYRAMTINAGKGYHHP